MGLFIASMQGKSFVTDPVVNQDEESAQFIVSAPLWDKGYNNTTQLFKVYYAVVDDEFLCGIVDQIKIGNTGSAYITRAGTVIAHQKSVYTMNNATSRIRNRSVIKGTS